AVTDTLVAKCRRALREVSLSRLVVAGGVGANKSLRQALLTLGEKENVAIYFPRLEFCTDNGAMIAFAGCQRLLAGQRDDLAIKVQARWSLEGCTITS
ncbi:MAG TPA: tRNA (adenosine(37)-N6)-threonylcarbamoyltransferase complex transferase subunit TsaD, partial [Gammaproteobacteria bacterium]|nr:tRNA (adenosine(37)-N6)-threonylcarbamoyltransferase complex transferase subunit TsaD [Gammaproteobacteria bacterium]